MSTTELITEGWRTPDDRTWGPLLADDRYNAGAIAWATGDISVLIATIILTRRLPEPSPVPPNEGLS